MSPLYKTLIQKFHPDICKEHYALERAKLINANKNDDSVLRRLAMEWGVIPRDNTYTSGPSAEDRFRQSMREQEDLRRRMWAQFNSRPVILTRAQKVERAFTRCGLRPNTIYYGLGIRLYSKRFGYIVVDRTSSEFVFYTDYTGKQRRTSITSCSRRT